MFRRLIWLAVGAFAIGTETFVVAPLLPWISKELQVSIAAAGQIVTIYAIGYGIGSPILAVIFGNVDRKWLLASGLAIFALGNALAALSQDLTQLTLARVLLALTAGLYTPTATAVAAAMVTPDKRGRAISTVMGGMTVAVALGTPLGTFIGTFANWRATFLMVAAICAIVALCFAVGLPQGLPRHITTLRQRLAVGQRPEILHGLAVTFTFAAGVFSLFTFLSAFLMHTVQFGPHGIIASLFVFGVGAACGTTLGGQAADRIGAVRSVRIGLIVLIAAMIAIAWAPTLLSPHIAGAIILTAIAVWGVSGWGLYAAQMANFVRMTPDVPMVALSLNASVFYLGVAAGAAVGSLVIAMGLIDDVAWIAAGGGVLALTILQFPPAAARPAMAPAE